MISTQIQTLFKEFLLSCLKGVIYLINALHYSIFSKTLFQINSKKKEDEMRHDEIWEENTFLDSSAANTSMTMEYINMGMGLSEEQHKNKKSDSAVKERKNDLVDAKNVKVNENASSKLCEVEKARNQTLDKEVADILQNFSPIPSDSSRFLKAINRHQYEENSLNKKKDWRILDVINEEKPYSNGRSKPPRSRKTANKRKQSKLANGSSNLSKSLAFTDENIELVRINSTSVKGQQVTEKQTLNSEGYSSVSNSIFEFKSPEYSLGSTTSSSSSDLPFTSQSIFTDFLFIRWLSDVSNVNNTHCRFVPRAPPGFPELPQNPPLTFYPYDDYDSFALTEKAYDDEHYDFGVSQSVKPAPTPLRHLYYDYPEFMDHPDNTSSSSSWRTS